MENVYRIGFDSRSAEVRARAFRKELQLTQNASQSLDRETQVLGLSIRQLGGIVSGAAIIQGFRAITQEAAELQAINRRIARSTDDVAGTNEFLVKTANDLSVSYKGVKDSYSRLLPLQKGGLITLEQTRAVTTGLADASAALGVTQVDAALSLRGLVQAMGSGERVKAEEFNQVFEAIPAVLLEVEQAAGLAAGGFRRLVVAGEVGATEFVERYVAGLAAFSGAAVDARDDINQSFTRIGSQYSLLAEQLTEPLNAALIPFANALEGTLANLATNSDEYVDALVAVATATTLVFGVKASSEVVKFANTKIAAVDKQILAERLLAKAQVDAAALNKTFDAQRQVSLAKEGVAESEAAAAATKADLIRRRSLVTQRELTVAKAQGIVVTLESTVAESANASAIAKTTAVQSARAVAEREQSALSATTNAVRLKQVTALQAAEAAQAKAALQQTAAIESQAVAQAQLDVSKQKARAQSGLLTSAQIAETKAVQAHSAAVAGQVTAQSALNTQKVAFAAATVASDVAQAKSAATITATTAAIRLQAIAAAAGTRAVAGLSAAMTFVGGPVGVAILAAYGVYKFVESIEDQNEVTSETIVNLDKIAKGYDATGEAAQEAAKKAIDAAKAELEQNKAKLLSLQSVDASQFTGRDRAGAERRRQAGIDDVESDVKALEESIARAEAGFVSAIESASANAAKAASQAADSALTASAEDIIGRVLDDGKIALLRQKIEDLPKLEAAGLIDEDQSARAEVAINKQIQKLGAFGESARLAEERQDALSDATDDYNSIAGSFDPSIALQNEYLANVTKLEEAQRLGAITAAQYAIQLDNLGQKFDTDSIELRISKERELRDLLAPNQDFSDLDNYQDSLRLLNSQLDKTPEKALAIQSAIATLNNDFLTQFDQVDPITAIEEKYDAQIESLRVFGERYAEQKAASDSKIIDLELDKWDAIEEAQDSAAKNQGETQQKQGAQLESFLTSQLSQAAQYSKTAFEADKAWRASQAAIAGYEMIQNAAAWGAKYGGPAGAFVAGAAVTGLVAKNIQGILNTRFGSASSSVSSTSGASGDVSTDSTTSVSDDTTAAAATNITVNVITDELIDRDKLKATVNSGLAESSATRDIIITDGNIVVNGERA